MTRAHQWENNAAANPGAGTAFGENGKSHANLSAKGGKKIVMDIALAIVDLPAQNLPEQNPLAQNKTDWGCGLTARKEGNYQRSSKSKRKRRRYVPADWVYYIQSSYPFQ